MTGPPAPGLQSVWSTLRAFGTSGPPLPGPTAYPDRSLGLRDNRSALGILAYCTQQDPPQPNSSPYIHVHIYIQSSNNSQITSRSINHITCHYP